MCVPTARVVVMSRARPVASSATGLPATPSTVNVTVFAAAAASGSTRAVKVTLWPNTDVVRSRVSVVVEAAWLTAWTKVALLPPAKIAEPL